MNSERNQNVHTHQTSLWMPQIPRLFQADDLRGVAVSWWPLSLAVTSVSDPMGPGHAECVLHSQMLSCRSCGQVRCWRHLCSSQAAPRMVTAVSACGLFWSGDFVSGHKAEIGKSKNCMPPGACSGCDLRSYLQVTRCSINFIIWILAVLSARSIISC